MAEAAIFSHERELELIRDFFGSSGGFFVDVGANDPKIDSQTWHFEQRGWTGILIEPQPGLAQRVQERAAKVYAVACSTPADAGAARAERRSCHRRRSCSAFSASNIRRAFSMATSFRCK